MPKSDEKQTTTNLILYYRFNNLNSHNDLDAWFIDFLTSFVQLIQINRIRLHNLYSRHSEDGGPVELDVREAYKGVLQPMRNARANRLVVYFTYQDAPMVLGLTLGEWEVSLSSQRKEADKLRKLATLLHFDNA